MAKRTKQAKGDRLKAHVTEAQRRTVATALLDQGHATDIVAHVLQVDPRIVARLAADAPDRGGR
jgi:endonuclease YncB( thermonuclease family)